MLRRLLFIFFIVCLETHLSACNIVVETSLGKIQGVELQTRLGKSFYSFRGVRYAKAPVGELRFKNPVPVQPWKPNVFDATQDGPMCPQPYQNETDLSEDCLRLNIYTRSGAHDVGRNRGHVIFFIHQGGLYSESSQSKNFAGPEHLMDRDGICLVTINYRLGSLGFLASGTADAPGNAGLKDQNLALRWVKKHIHNFGCNPESVTLFGYSSGAISSILHMMSPMSRGLFDNVIAMSGSPIGQYSYEANGLELVKRQAKLLNCTTESATAAIKCLQKRPMLDFARSQPAMFEIDWNPILNWKVVIEKDFGQERFIEKHPFLSLCKGEVADVPLIMGMTEFEVLAASFSTVNVTSRLEAANNNFFEYAPITFSYERHTTRSRLITKAFSAFYFEQWPPLSNPESLEPLGEIISDSTVGFEIHRFAELFSRFYSSNIFMYLFRYTGRYSHFYISDQQPYGAVHHDELMYLFHQPLLTPLFNSTDPENEIIEVMTRLWVQFARKSNPNNPRDRYLKHINWRPYTLKEKAYLDIDKRQKLKLGGFFQKRFALWDKLFPISIYPKCSSCSGETKHCT